MKVNACGTCRHDVEHEGKPVCAVVNVVWKAVAEQRERSRWKIPERVLSEEEWGEQFAKFLEGVVPGYHAMQVWTRTQRWNPDGLPIDPVESCPTWKERSDV